MRTRFPSFMAVCALVLGTMGFAPSASRAADLSDHDVALAEPNDLEAFDGWVYFGADHPAVGSELWRSNGSRTELVANLTSGESIPWALEAVDGWLYFSARGSANTGRELWRTNAATTELVVDLVPGSESSSPASLAGLDGWVYFRATTPGAGSMLWRSDGTVTEPVADVQITSNLQPLDGWLYFGGTTPDTGDELWRTNGTTTELVADINPGTTEGADSAPRDLERLGGWVFFGASGAGDAATDRELWRTDGTTTEQVADIWPGTRDGSFPEWMEAMGDWVYFSATDGTGEELWRSNGVVTELVADIDPGGSSNPSALEAAHGWLFFTATTPDVGSELWRSNGVVTEFVADINPGPDGSGIGDPEALDGWVYFRAQVPPNESALWRSNGIVTEPVDTDVGDFFHTGYVSHDDGPRWSSTLYRALESGVHEFALYWWRDADLRIAVREADGKRWIGDNTSDDKPKHLAVALDAGVTYRVAVWAVGGGGMYDVAVKPPVIAGEEIFACTVDAERVAARKWVRTFYTPDVAGDHTLLLDWDGDASLRISVKERATGRLIGKHVTGDQPKALRVPLEAGVEYKIAVWAFTGSADFTVTVYAPTG